MSSFLVAVKFHRIRWNWLDMRRANGSGSPWFPLLIQPVFESLFYGGAKITFLATESLHNLKSKSPFNLV
jgi:hypothetical protein